MHVHLWYAQNQLPTFIAFGVTGVQDMGSDFKRTSAWRDAIENGTAVGPHILTSGPPVDGRPSDDDKLPVIVARNAAEARAAFDQLWNMNVDFIKVLSGLSRESYLRIGRTSPALARAAGGPHPDGGHRVGRDRGAAARVSNICSA